MGDSAELFDGRGLVATCRVVQLRKRDVTLDVLETRRTPTASRELVLATAVPKGDRFDWLIEKATELGVTRIIPITTTRSVVDPRESKLDKLRQTVIAACKQSCRNHLMEIAAVTPWSKFIEVTEPGSHLFVAHPQGGSVEELLRKCASDTNPIIFAIGPEGGFSEEEVALALSRGAGTIHLGGQILRIETAALALAARFLL